ncbi:peptidyl-prolyl cis-trans isomerase-like 4 [Rhizoctonia solani AG-1 IA]|uniref:peptidylprolyl isomerase n=1 Tax=Thanatephorus cucumeris (strain AG1-IA) TaxID=983506 RepID=L8X6K4_THACA|nr:peptidyl-prolyl cis-trans isomerase-like 4 [Rhizoctonia solani AG-1 IA]
MAKLDSPVDFSHHLSDEARGMKPNPLKGMYKYWGMPGLVNLAGLPHPSLFPYETMSADVLPPSAFSVGGSDGLLSWIMSAFRNRRATTQITIPKYANPKDGPNEIQLSTALQYSMVEGLPAFVDFVRNFTLRVFQPAYSDFRVLANSGNTDGWTKACTILCQPGEFILTEDWTYPGALLSAWPSGVRPYPVPMDNLGMIPRELEQILEQWNEVDHEGKRRPHVMYTIPVGQNPTGAVSLGCGTQQVSLLNPRTGYGCQAQAGGLRYLREIWMTPITSSNIQNIDERAKGAFVVTFLAKSAPKRPENSWIRWPRTIGPGCRLGWTTCNALFATVMGDYSASKTNQSSGISQAMVMQLVSKQWGHDGYIRWLRGIGAQYTERRNLMLDSLFESSSSSGLELVQNHGVSQETAAVYDAYAKPNGVLYDSLDEKFPPKGKTLFSFSLPNAGMFLWIKFHIKNHRDWVPHPTSGSKLEVKLWTDLAEAGVMFAPGYMFSTDEDDSPSHEGFVESDLQPEYAHMRVSFSSSTKEEIAKAMKTFVEPRVKSRENAMSVLLETSLGDLVIDLEVESCPRTCENFLKLCKVYYYNLHAFFNGVFLTKDFVAQAGDPTATGTGGESARSYIASKADTPTPDVLRYFAPELVPRLKHTAKGTVSMAIAPGVDGGCGSQFFITLADNIDYLDGKHAVFGHVVEGLETLDQLNEVFTDQDGRPMKDVRIRHVVILDDPFPDPPGLIVPNEVPTKAPDLTGTNVRIGEDEDPLATLPEEEAEKIRRERAAAAAALTLEMVGDLPFANVRPPENVLFVCKLNPVTRDEDLELIFSRFGVIMSCQIIRDKKTGDSLQYAFIEFDKREDAEQCHTWLLYKHSLTRCSSQSVSKLNTHWSNNPMMPKRGDRGGGGFAGRDDLEETRRYSGEDSKKGGGGGFGMLFDHSSRAREERSRSQSPARGGRDKYRRSDDRDDCRDKDRHRHRDRDRDSRREARHKDMDRDRDRRDRDRDRDRRRY